MSSHLTIFSNPCADFSCALTCICEVESSSNADEFGTLVTAASISSGVLLHQTDTRHPTCAYCSIKFAAGCCLALYLENTRPHYFPSMTPSEPVNYSSNRRWSSANSVADLFFYKCLGMVSCFSVGCTVAAAPLKLRFLLRLDPGRDCMSDLCLRSDTWNCGWAVQLKSRGLARSVKCTIESHILLLTLLVLQMLASKLSSACSRVLQLLVLPSPLYLSSLVF